MIRLHPIPDVDCGCPHCERKLDVRGWYMPGMRTLADMSCGGCGREFYGDLPVGQGLYTPILVERATGAISESHGAPWFAAWLENSYRARTSRALALDVDEVLPVRKPLLLNCLDTLYGHSLLKLLNCQYYLDSCTGFDLVVVAPKILRWMVPEGVAEVWSVDLPLSRGTEWNDWLADRFAERFARQDEVMISKALSHPHPEDYAIERFTRVHPFDLARWEQPLSSLGVTYVWRDDRLWESCVERQPRECARWLKHKVCRGRWSWQTQHVWTLAEFLRRRVPELRFTVTGLSEPGGLPPWICDLRRPRPDAGVEKSWCEQFASSHLVIGVHGSGMLLASGHAGGVIELVPDDRWGNVIQDLLPRTTEVRTTIRLHRLLPLSCAPHVVGAVAESMVKQAGFFSVGMSRNGTRHTCPG